MNRKAAKLSVVESRSEEMNTMTQFEYTESLVDYIGRILEPCASFSRLLLASSENDGLPCRYEDIGQISGALTTLVKTQMNNFADRFEGEIGDLTIVLPVKDDFPIEVRRFFLKEKEEK